MKTKPYKFRGKIFRYDFDCSVVEYIEKADEDMISAEKEWRNTHDWPLYGIDDDGYVVLGSVGLRKENWINKAVRDEYLSGWSDELDEEAAVLVDEFLRYG